MSRIETMLTRACQVAATSTCKKRHGVVIAHGPRVMAVGVNSYRGPDAPDTYHAEIAAVKALNTTVPFAKLSVYSARVTANGKPAIATPCGACATELTRLGFNPSNIHWTL